MLTNPFQFSHFFPALRKQLTEVFFVHSIDSFVNSMFAIFIPIYLLILGFSVSQVLIYFIIKYLFLIVFFFLAGFIASRLGLKHTMFIRLPFFLLFLLMLFFLETKAIPFIILPILNAFYESLYWMPLHSLFARSASTKHIGSNVGELHSVSRIASVVAPFIGGLITVFFGFNILFIVAMVLLLISVVPLFYTPEIKPHVDFNIGEIKNIVKSNPKYFFGLGFQYMTDAAEVVIWPIFVFLTLNSVLSVGIVGSLLYGGMVLFALLVGKLSDKFKKRIFIRMGAALMIIIFFFRFFISTTAAIFLLTILAGFFSVILFVPFDSIIYSLAKKSNIDEFIIVREVYVDLGRVFLLLIALIFVNHLNISFLLASAANIFFLFF